MRGILFRGKRVDNGEWVEGFYVHQYNCHTIYLPDDAELVDGFFDYVNVIPETVGQFTGMTDKNGVKIFEGDIIRFKHNGKIYIDVVEYSPPMFSPSNSCRWSMWKDEIIGNIHDNPELLGGE